ncbi:MAG: alpha-L-fucosidase [Halanaerobiales bacterium]
MEVIRERILAEMNRIIKEGEFSASWDSLGNYHPPDWYAKARFGIFIHWGVYSVPAFGNEWYPRNMYIQGSQEFTHHLKKYGPHLNFGYKDFIPQFMGEKFSPSEWMDLFYRAGARYVVPVAEHHDGFQMYDSALSQWNSVNMGPKRDIIGELAAAAHRENLHFGLSSHRAEHWWYYSGGREFSSEVSNQKYRDFYGPAQRAPEDLMGRRESSPDRSFLRDWLARSCELVKKYEPELIYFDWWIQNHAFSAYLQKFAAYYYNYGGELPVLNYKYDGFPEGTAVFDIERGQTGEIRDEVWQTCTSLSRKSWCFVENQDYKPVTEVIQSLVDAVSKNGCFLLNVGPRPDGTIPREEKKRLLAIGKWLAINGEAIYGSCPWLTFGEGPTETEVGPLSDGSDRSYTGRDFRFTWKDDNLYVVVMDIPEDKDYIKIYALGKNSEFSFSGIGEIKILDDEARVISWERKGDYLQVNCRNLDSVYCIPVLKIISR